VLGGGAATVAATVGGGDSRYGKKEGDSGWLR
jgi:hypothetical protein